MADIRSAAGDGPEPGVPGRDQPAQELANLIANSDAKGKGFWRRRRRKSQPEPAAPAAAPEPPPASAPEPSLASAPAQPAEPEVKQTEPETKQSGAAVKQPEGEAGGKAEVKEPGEAPVEAAAAEEAAEAQAESAGESSGSEPEEASEATSEDAEKVSEAESADEADTSSDGTQAGEATAEVAADAAEVADSEAVAAEVSADGGDAPAVEAAQELARPTVGVVYEPDESPDGFPLEFGNIIVGLPKQQSGGEQESEEGAAAVEGSSEDTPVSEAASAEDADGAPADEADETAADEPTEGAEADDAAAEPADGAEAEDLPEAEDADDVEDAAETDDVPETDDSAEAADGAADGADESTSEEAADGDDAGEVSAEADVAGEQETAEEVEPGDDADGEQEAEGDEAGAQETSEDAPTAEAGDGAPEDAADGADAGESGKDADADSDDEGAADDSAEGAAEDSAGDAEGAGDGSEADEEQVDEVEELTAEQLAERLAAEQAAMALITALMKLRGALAVSQLPIDVVGADEARQQQKAMLDQLDDYILPRLVQLEAPVLAVVGGSTGAGKSTLVNTIIGKVVSEPGVLRPTTRSPVLIHHPADADWFVGDRVLPGMARTTADSPGGMEDAGQLRLVAADTVPRGLAILDAPDIDSVVEANRDLATQLLAAADLWLFVTTAARYSDAVPWDFLQSASDRSTAVAVVLDRAPAETIDDITGHLAQMLLERGLGDSPLFSIKEIVVDSNGMLPAEVVASIKDWLIDLAADAEARAAVVRRTLHGAVTAMVKKTPPFAAAVRAQADTVIELRSTVESAYDQAVKDIAKAAQDATLLRGEVLARWQEFVGTGELLKGLQTNVGRLRDKMKTSLSSKTAPPTRDLNDAIESGLESLLREHAAAAAERAEKAWQSTAAGRQLLAVGGPGLGAMSEEFPAAAGRTVREWQAFVLDLIRTEGADKRSTARILEYGVNGLALSLTVALFASEAGIPTGAEASAGVGSAVVGRKLLEAVFGEEAVRTLVAKAQEDLDGKVHALMDAEFARYLTVLDQHPVDPEAARQLTEAARAVEDCT